MFTLIDNDNEVIPEPYLGHKGQKYVRTDSEIYSPVETDQEGYYLRLGENKPIYFSITGYAATIVGPGAKGVGDKNGGSIEQSIGYNDILSEYEGV